MKSLKKEWKVLLVAMVFIFGFIMIGAISAPSVGAWGCHSQILPMQKEYYGKTYSELAVKWWQWALGTPASINPLFDATGEFCDAGQKGPVWFLASTLGYSDESNPVERTCAMPYGRALFFPIINSVYLMGVGETEAEQRSKIDCRIPKELFAEIDGVPVKNLYQYYEHSPTFDIQLPDDPIFGPDYASLLLTPNVDAGYYLLVWPLSPGMHKVHWKATWECPFDSSGVANPTIYNEYITYNLNVKKKCH
jgi:hypothetical protein